MTTPKLSSHELFEFFLLVLVVVFSNKVLNALYVNFVFSLAAAADDFEGIVPKVDRQT